MRRRALSGYPLALLLALALLAGCAGGDSRPAIDKQKAADANSALGFDYLQRGQLGLALEALLKARGFDSNHLQANWGLGLTYSRLNEPDKARKHFDQAVRAAPRPDVLNSYAAFLCEQGETGAAIEQFERAADHANNTRPALALTNAGLCVFQAGKLAEAEDYYSKALTIEPGYSAAIGRMAELRFTQGFFDQARAYLRQLDADGELGGDWLLLAARVELARADHSAALNYLRRYNIGNPGREKTLGQISTQP